MAPDYNTPKSGHDWVRSGKTGMLIKSARCRRAKKKSGQVLVRTLAGAMQGFQVLTRGRSGGLNLVAGVNTGPPPSTNGIAITTVGSVGIGTLSPFLNTKLDIVGGLFRLDQLAGGGDEALCRNSAVHTLATCS
jgi:hypothetical protein